MVMLASSWSTRRQIVLEEYRFRQRQSELERARLNRLRHTPAVTLDGQVGGAAGQHRDCRATGQVSPGVQARWGLASFRSEFLFMNRGERSSRRRRTVRSLPQCAVESMHGLPVTIRTVDVGADKPLDRHERVRNCATSMCLNPALGLRAIRWSSGRAGHVSPATARHPAGQRALAR